MSNLTKMVTKEPDNDVETVCQRLLDSVKGCQCRYGGKKELATELDQCVNRLCNSWEAVLLHGYRKTPLKHSVPGFHISTETKAFWPFVQEHLTKHERERYTVLKQIWTDTGRGRAWLRATLNERSLERYIHSFLANTNLLQRYYEDWALMRNQEKSNLLPNMAAGLTTILFAISIDKAEFNSAVRAQKDGAHGPTVEPVVSGPPPLDKINGNRVKKKKPRPQLITFDESSGSLGAAQTSDAPESNSESSEDYQTPEHLTPIIQMDEIGELTPISVEINNQDYDASNASDDLVEIPTDISAVLSALEIRSNEELQKKEEKIEILTTENCTLKEQVKRYVSAIQMLRLEDNDTVLNILDGLQIADTVIDYKNEAKLYEQKLIQVAEMHGELMDFNTALQQQLVHKEQLLEKLKEELESLRGPLPSIEHLNLQSTVNIWIPSAYLTGVGSKSYHVYQIYLRAGTEEWNIYRRYAQFYRLQCELKKLDPTVGVFDFPPKISLGKRDANVVEDRRKRLQTYLRKILTHWPELAQCNSRFLLEQHLAFFKDQKTASKDQQSSTGPGTYTGL